MSAEWKKRKVEDDEVQTEEQVTQLISLWSQDQLIRVLSKLGAEHSVAMQEILRENQNDPKLRKIFVRNLPYTVTQTSFREFFSQYGTVTEAVIIMDKTTAASKGFGFVTYDTVEAANACLLEPTKDIDGRQIFVNLAAKKDGQALGGVATGTPGAVGRRDEDNTLRKLFVWSLSYETTSQQLLDFFKTWGEVTEAVVLTNRDTGTSKGYGFVTMGTQESAQKALMDPVKSMAGRSIHVKLAAASDGKHSGSASQGGTLLSVPSYGQYGAMPMGMYGGMMGMMPGGAYPPSQQYQYPAGTAPASYPTGYPGWS
jgi:heterogeneous nuclear ribonucleoprotein A1/A3